jgi:hypothetical protein
MSETVETQEATTQPTAIALIVAESGVEQTKAQTVLASFSAYFEQAAKWERQTKGLVITDASQTKEMKLAREGRLQLKEVRVNAKKTHDKLKEGALLEGRFIDSIYNLIEGVTKPLETALLEKEQFIERQEAARVEALRCARAEELALYQVDTSFYDLGNMPEASFKQLLENSQIAAEAKLKAQRQAEEDRIAAEKAAQEEQARVAAENARLKAEAEAREAEIAAERAKAEEERRAREAEEAQERARLAAEQKAKDDAAEAERQKAAQALALAQEEAEKAKRALQAKAEAEAKALREEAARLEADRLAKLEAERRAAQAGDADKVLAYIVALEAVKAPTVASPEAQAILDGCATIFGRARTAAEKLA